MSLTEPFLIAAAFGVAYTSLKIPMVRRSRRERELFAKGNMHIPTHFPCNAPSPDGILKCRMECGHGGWHSHHGPVMWYFDKWSEAGDPDNRWGNIPW